MIEDDVVYLPQDDVWNVQKKKLLIYKDDEKHVVIPKGIKEIGRFALINEKLESVSIPDSVRVIGFEAFRNNNLRKVEFPQNLEFIGPRAFAHNVIKSIIINSNLTIDESAFIGNALKRIKLTRKARNITWALNKWTIFYIKVLEIVSYTEHSDFCNLCPNIEELHIDNIPVISVKRFLIKCKLHKKKNLRKIYIKNEISSFEKFALKAMWPNISFEYEEQKFIEDYEVPNQIQENPVKSEFQEKLDKIYQVTSLLSEKERIAIENNVTLLLEQYKEDLKKCQPNFEMFDGNLTNLHPTDIQTLKHKLQNDLDAILFNLGIVRSAKKLIEDIAEYRKLLNTKIENVPEEATKTQEQINFIILTYQKLAEPSIKNQLIDILNHFQERASQEIIETLNNTNKLSLELDITADFQKQIAVLYEKTKNFCAKKDEYQELLDSLELKNNSELAIDIRTAKEIIKIFYTSDRNRLSEELEKIIMNYKNEIKKIISDENIQDIKRASEIELELRKELQPLLVEIHELNPQAICFHKLKEELINALKYIKKENTESLSGAITEMVKELELVLENENLNVVKSRMYFLINACLTKWYNELNENEYKILESIPKNIGTERLSNHFRFELLVLKELLVIKENIENYRKENIEYAKAIQEVFDPDESILLQQEFLNKSLLLLNKQGAFAEELTLDAYKNHLLTNYHHVCSGEMPQEEWKKTIEKDYNDVFLNNVIVDTKKFIFFLFNAVNGFCSKGIYIKIEENRKWSDPSDIVIDLKRINYFTHIGDNRYERESLNEDYYSADILFCPLASADYKINYKVSFYLLKVFFEDFRIFKTIDVDGSKIVRIVGPKAIFDMLYENNCSIQTLKRKKIELNQMD